MVQKMWKIGAVVYKLGCYAEKNPKQLVVQSMTECFFIALGRKGRKFKSLYATSLEDYYQHHLKIVSLDLEKTLRQIDERKKEIYIIKEFMYQNKEGL